MRFLGRLSLACVAALFAAPACGTNDPGVFGADSSGGGGQGGAVGGGGSAGETGLPPSCGALAVTESGVYEIYPEGVGSGIEVYCDQEANGGGWALVFSSVGSRDGDTLEFWRIPYGNRLDQKGSPDPNQNHISPSLYLYGREYRDEIESVAGKTVDAFVATVTGFDDETFQFVSPERVSGEASMYAAQFAGGWSSADFDADGFSGGNCAQLFSDVTQHYEDCFVYSLGTDADGPVEDDGWGPHVSTGALQAVGIAPGDEGATVRVARISRWARW